MYQSEDKERYENESWYDDYQSSRYVGAQSHKKSRRLKSFSTFLSLFIVIHIV
jgi:hypothetical protein